MKTQPFGRALALMAAISAAVGQGGFVLSAAQAAAAGYKSRGHGKGVPGKAYHSRSKYAPHQGAQECLRRRVGGFYGYPKRLHADLLRLPEGEIPQLQPNGTYTYSDGSYVRFLHSEGL